MWTPTIVKHVEVSSGDWKIVRNKPLRYLISYGIFLSGNSFSDYPYFKFKAKPKELSSQNVQREFRTSVIDDTQEVHRVGLEDDEFVFALSNKRLKATSHPEKLAIGWRLKRFPMREILMRKKEGPFIVWPPHPKSLASVATLIDRPEVVGQISESNLSRGRSFQKRSSLRDSSEMDTQ